MATERRRGCGYRKVGGLYLVLDGAGTPCDRLPIPASVCPTCGHGIKQARGWTWIDLAALVDGPHDNCLDMMKLRCPLCDDPEVIGRAGLIWVGEKFYPTPRHFHLEATGMGISRRIAAVPRGFEVGKTWVLLGHAKTILCSKCKGAGVVEGGSEPDGYITTCCNNCRGAGHLPGLFMLFKPSRIEKILTESQATPETREELSKRGITVVTVPDDDPDHRGTVYEETEEGELIPLAA